MFFAHLNVEVLKCHSVSAEQLHRVPGYEADSKETLHLVRAGPLGHLGTEAGERQERRLRDKGRERESKVTKLVLLVVTGVTTSRGNVLKQKADVTNLRLGHFQGMWLHYGKCRTHCFFGA